MNISNHEQSQPVFKRLKTVCVPLMGATALTASSVPTVSRLLTELLDTLHDIRSSGYSLNEPTIKYVFFPIYTLLNRNDSTAIPDQLLEKTFAVLNSLCEDWWWYLDLNDWDQLFMLCGSVIGGIGTKGKEKERADETKEAAAHCLLTLLRSRDNVDGPLTPNQVQSRMKMFVEHTQTPTLIPIIGQTLNSILLATECHSLSLQRSMLDLLFILLSKYFPDDLIVSVLPGVVSTTCKLCLGAPGNKGWAKGAVVEDSLRVMQEVISRSIGDEPCIEAGAVLSVENIEELVDLVSERSPKEPAQEERKYGTSRTPSWLNVTSSQLLIAMKSLSTLIKHPSPSALTALAEFSAHVLRTTPTTLPQTQPLLLSYLLALSNSELPSVSKKATELLLDLLSASSKARHSLIRTLMRITRDNLIALPALLPSQADAKVEHVAGIIEAICRLANTNNSLSPIASEIGKLLGPSGGVEKWGWSLLSVLELVDPPVTVTRTSTAQMMLENDPEASAWLPFPQPMLRNVSSTTTHDSLVRMFHALGRAAGDSGLSAVEWFVNMGQSGKDFKAVTGMWCACRLLEGISNVSLFEDPSTSLRIARSKRLEKLGRGLVKSVALLWDNINEDSSDTPLEGMSDKHVEVPITVQHVKGMVQLHDTLQITRGTPIGTRTTSQPMLHNALSLQLISVAAGILESRFAPLFIYSLYPILHSLVSPFSFLSETALRALTFVTVCTSYASPANLLLSNFDYVLDSVSRRLSRQWLDVDATKVLAVMIRLVGSDIVERAGDVVEECFDRLDEYHGYEIVVEGLVEILGEVMKVIQLEEMSKQSKDETPPLRQRQADQQKFDTLFEWLAHRHESTTEDAREDYGPAPRKAWGEDSPSNKDKGKQPENVPEVMPDEETSLTSSQALTKQIVQRSMYFLTHESTGIRARILNLLSSSVPVLSESALMPSIHSAWPFILHRLADTEVFVVSAAAGLVEALVTTMGDLMFRRVWDDVWPRFRSMLSRLETADKTNTLSRRVRGGVGTESVYTHSHRLYRSIIKTMTAALKGVDPQDSSNWEVIVAFRRFLHSEAAEELQQCAQKLYIAAGTVNADAVWLALTATSGQLTSTSTRFLHESQWDIVQNVALILGELDSQDI
ncbi:armadillo-type protein [Lentinula aciculospora]|uniref:Armadillo-type protein n=1 Tax=Lentinula aciculospora TaxID=153920 RepID=A0A9W9DTW4_9AGAR|nr:armadillo-type protein [Lentinula aciculospora]